MAVRLNVTFCVLSPALAHARRSPLGTGARTRALGVDGVVQMFVPWVASLGRRCRASARAARRVAGRPGHHSRGEGSSSVARVMNRSRMSAPICCLTHIDTAEIYGLFHSEELVGQASSRKIQR